MTILITGGCGFIGANFILEWIQGSSEKIINLDKLTYAGNLENLKSLANYKNYTFIQGDISDHALIKQILKTETPRAILNFAAESHVDRSIHDADVFIQTNIVGCYNLLKTAHEYWKELSPKDRNKFRFLHISTDEVYGALTKEDLPFKETNRYEPNNLYSASKAASDHIVRSFYHTHQFPVLTTNCSNNYGPLQFPEKLIPLVIQNAIENKPLPIYGDGLQIRDWIYVSDHCSGLRCVLEGGKVGETYNIGSMNERTNLEVVQTVCDLLDRHAPRQDKKSYRAQISFIQDRPGHDRRYAIDNSKIHQELNWRPQESFKTGLEQTVLWYLQNQPWVQNIKTGEYKKWIKKQYR